MDFRYYEKDFDIGGGSEAMRIGRQTRQRIDLLAGSGDSDFAEAMLLWYGPRFDHGMDHHHFRVFKIEEES